jgi:hypothetical protein
MNKLLLAIIPLLAASYTYAQTFNPTPSIRNTGTANGFSGGYTFAYATSGSPYNGAFMSFGGLGNAYDCQISADYGVNGGNHISFRTRNGDIQAWNSWNEIWHSGNLNNTYSSFEAYSLHIAAGSYSPAQGAYLGWNHSGGLGEVNLVSNIGQGVGGFTFDNTNDGVSFTRLVTILGNGNMGVGTINPDAKLAVAGTIHSQAVNVDMTGWSDYVFKPSYSLAPLAEVKSYIDQNHHLPDVPSEEQVKKDGINLGEMNAKLLKKIEELTLYMIDKDKQVNELQQKVLQIEKKLTGKTSQPKK